MRETRVPLTELKPGEMIIRVGTREIGARFRGLRDVQAGHRVRGPRGGAYALTAEGAREYVVLETYTGKPIVKRASVAVVLRDPEA